MGGLVIVTPPPPFRARITFQWHFQAAPELPPNSRHTGVCWLIQKNVNASCPQMYTMLFLLPLPNQPTERKPTQATSKPMLLKIFCPILNFEHHYFLSKKYAGIRMFVSSHRQWNAAHSIPPYIFFKQTLRPPLPWSCRAAQSKASNAPPQIFKLLIF